MHSIVEVRSKKEWKWFHGVPHRVYQDDSNWICPLESDIESVFDPQRNKTLDNGEAALFVLLDDAGQPAGRISAFIDHKRNKTQPFPVGGIGFFDCLNNKDYAFALFEAAETWLKGKGAKAVDGPINFGERDKFWGLLVRGFYPPLFQENYNPAYYIPFFEEWGFIPFEQVLTLKGDAVNVPAERLEKMMAMLSRRYNIRADYLHMDRLDQSAKDLCEVYNAAFRQFEHFKPLDTKQVFKMVEEAKPILDPKIISLLYVEDNPAGFCICLPDINGWLKPAKGKLNWRTIPGFLWRKWRAKKGVAKAVAFGVHPDYRSKGIAGALLAHIARAENRTSYPEMYFATIRAHNTEAVSIYLKMGVEIDRLHLAYRKALEEGIEVAPHEFIELPEHLQ